LKVNANETEDLMKLDVWKGVRFALASAIYLFLSVGATLAVAADSGQIASGQKAKVKGVIVSRSGDLVKIQDKKSDAVEVVKLGESTTIERERGLRSFFRHEDMDVTALVPGLTIEAEGTGNADGQLEATRVKFNPDVFAINVAEEQQIQSNRAAARNAQTTADQGVADALGAQTSADKAQSTAEQGVATAVQAGTIAAVDAEAVQAVNQRVSDLADYTTVAEAQVYFPDNSSVLDTNDKKDLDQLVSSTSGATGYLIEIAGYASSTGPAEHNQKLSEDRAASVVHYLIEKDNVPMRRIVVPAGFGATHPAAENTDKKGRALNRRVDVKILVNKGLQGSL
jgi:outer membrane protein OmpA-like peptidoglycan-associated protein